MKKKISYAQMNGIAIRLKSFSTLSRPLSNDEIQFIMDNLDVPDQILAEYQREKGVPCYENYTICMAQGRN